MTAVQPEEPFYFQSNEKEIFALLGTPGGSMDLREGVILCAPAPFELKKFHWTMRQIALSLQSSGYHTLRFDYFGSGDSEGESRAFNLEDSRANIQDAVRYLKNSGHVRRITLVGVRLGCPLALAACEVERVKRIVLIDPVYNGQAYLTEIQTMHQNLVAFHKIKIPTLAEGDPKTQRLGFPYDVTLAWQTQQIGSSHSYTKTKGVTLISTKNSPNPNPLIASLINRGEDVKLIELEENLRWGQSEALFIQDFPNKLIRTVVDSVRGLG
jgi:pimeloyl-ACP methyl ester carboxylesterase